MAVSNNLEGFTELNHKGKPTGCFSYNGEKLNISLQEARSIIEEKWQTSSLQEKYSALNKFLEIKCKEENITKPNLSFSDSYVPKNAYGCSAPVGIVINGDTLNNKSGALCLETLFHEAQHEVQKAKGKDTTYYSRLKIKSIKNLEYHGKDAMKFKLAYWIDPIEVDARLTAALQMDKHGIKRDTELNGQSHATARYIESYRKACKEGRLNNISAEEKKTLDELVSQYEQSHAEEFILKPEKYSGIDNVSTEGIETAIKNKDIPVAPTGIYKTPKGRLGQLSIDKQSGTVTFKDLDNGSKLVASGDKAIIKENTLHIISKGKTVFSANVADFAKVGEHQSLLASSAIGGARESFKEVIASGIAKVGDKFENIARNIQRMQPNFGAI